MLSSEKLNLQYWVLGHEKSHYLNPVVCSYKKGNQTVLVLTVDGCDYSNGQFTPVPDDIDDFYSNKQKLCKVKLLYYSVWRIITQKEINTPSASTIYHNFYVFVTSGDLWKDKSSSLAIVPTIHQKLHEGYTTIYGLRYM